MTPEKIAETLTQARQRGYDRGKGDAEAGRNRNNPFTESPEREAYDRGWRNTANRKMTRSFNRALGW